MVKRKREDYEISESKLTRSIEMKEREGSHVVFLDMENKQLDLETFEDINQYFAANQSQIEVVVIRNFIGISDDAVNFLEGTLDSLNLRKLKLEGTISAESRAKLETFDKKLHLLPEDAKIPKRSRYDELNKRGFNPSWENGRDEYHDIIEATEKDTENEYLILLDEQKITQQFEEAEELGRDELEITINGALAESDTRAIAFGLIGSKITSFTLNFEKVSERATRSLVHTLFFFQQTPLEHLSLNGEIPEVAALTLCEYKKEGLTLEINGQEMTLPSTAPQKTRSAEKIKQEEEMKYPDNSR